MLHDDARSKLCENGAEAMIRNVEQQPHAEVANANNQSTEHSLSMFTKNDSAD